MRLKDGEEEGVVNLDYRESYMIGFDGKDGQRFRPLLLSSQPKINSILCILRMVECKCTDHSKELTRNKLAKLGRRCGFASLIDASRQQR